MLFIDYCMLGINVTYSFSVPVRLFSMETSGPPKFPSYPFVHMPCSIDPGGVLSACHSAFRTAAFRWVDCVGFPSDVPKVILMTMTIHISGLNNTACKLVPPGSVPSLTGTHAGFATDLPAQL